MRRFKLSFLLVLISISSFSQISTIKDKINNVINNKNAGIGVAILDLNSNESVVINGEEHFPMQSVFKFPIALKVLNDVDNDKIKLSDSIFISSAELQKKTWSTIQEKYPNGNIKMALSDIIYYMVAISDNIGCDVILKNNGGASSVNHYLRSIGIENMTIKINEAEQQAKPDKQVQNWTTPNEAINLLTMFYKHSLLKPATQNFLWDTMKKTATGSIKNKLPKGIVVIHKTGSAPNIKNGTAVNNDVGIMIFPNKKAVAYAIFIKDSKETSDTNYNIIAEIGKIIAENKK
jgi:Beta-lactamase class A